MNTAKKVLAEIADPPESLQQGVLGFAHFLKQRAGREQQRNLGNAQLSSLERLWDHRDDEVWNDVPVRFSPSTPITELHRQNCLHRVRGK